MFALNGGVNVGLEIDIVIESHPDQCGSGLILNRAKIIQPIQLSIGQANLDSIGARFPTPQIESHISNHSTYSIGANPRRFGTCVVSGQKRPFGLDDSVGEPSRQADRKGISAPSGVSRLAAPL